MAKEQNRLRTQAELKERDKLRTRAQAAEFLGLKPQTLAAWAMTGKHLPIVHVGDRAVRYRQSDLEEFIERQTVPAS